MSLKSERKKQVKAEKQAFTPIQWFADMTAYALDDHNTSCTEKVCHGFVLGPTKDRLVAMVKSGEPKKLYIAPYGTDTARDYKPVTVLHLATGAEIAGAFDEDGKVHCAVTGKNEQICLTLLCHHKGITLAVHHDAPDAVSVVCAECRNPLKFDGIDSWKMKLQSM